MNKIKKEVIEAEEEIKEAVFAIEKAKDTIDEAAEKDESLTEVAKDMERAEHSAAVACEATEEAESKL